MDLRLGGRRVPVAAECHLGDGSGADRLAELASQVEGPRAPLAARYARALTQDNGAELDVVSRDFEAMGDILAAADAAAHAATSHRLAGRRGSALSSSARAQALANPAEFKKILVEYTKLSEPVIERQLSRTELTHSAIGQAQVDTITAAGLALKEAGVLPATTDVKAAVDSLVDRRFVATN